MSDLLLSDLHLPTNASPLREAFLRFCQGPARTAQQVFILGDLFESWIGDAVGLKDYAPEISALRALSRAGVKIKLIHGNRDFLLGRDFSRVTGVKLLPDLVSVELGGQPTLLAHGDTFCTDDLGYQRWRKFSRHPLAQWLFLRLPVSCRLRIAGGLRGGSNKAKSNKAQAIMDVNAAAITAAFASQGTSQLIHGHTHRPAEHLHPVDGRDCTRIVLADWRPERIEWLRCDAEGCRRESF